MITGSDIVILAAGTTTILINVDSNVGTTYNYSYSTQQSVDIGIIMQGYRVKYIRGYALAATNTSLPVSQDIDLNYI